MSTKETDSCEECGDTGHNYKGNDADGTSIIEDCKVCTEPMSDDECEQAEHAARVEKLEKEYGAEVCAAALYLFDDAYWMDALEGGAYCGEYRNLMAYAESYVDDSGLLAGVDEVVARYFDYESFGRDLELGGDISFHNGHVFNNNY